MHVFNIIFYFTIFIGSHFSFFLSGFEARAQNFFTEKFPHLVIRRQGKSTVSASDQDLRFRLARNLEYGIGVPQDHEMAMAAYLDASNMGHDQAFVALASYYLYGKNEKKYNYNNCFSILSHAVQKSQNDDLRLLLGICYFRGIGTEKNFFKACSYFKQSVALPLAKHMLALCYEFAIGTPKNLHEAQRLRSLSFVGLNKPGLSDYSSEIKFALGYSYLNGYGCDVDFNTGIKWIEASAKEGNLFASHYLGFCYEHGFGVRRDEEKSRSYFLKSTEHRNTNGFLESEECRIEGIRAAFIPVAFTCKVQEFKYERVASLRLGKDIDHEAGATPMLEKGVGIIDDTDQDPSQLFRSYQMGAERSDPVDMFQLARLYETRRGLPDISHFNSASLAIQWYIKAAKGGLVEAMYNAGVCLETGYGLFSKDFDQAFQWYLAAAERNFAPAQFACGNCYLLGRGTQRDIEKALLMWSKASKNNYGKAFVMLGDYAYHVAHNERDAVKYYMSAIEIGESQGCLALAHFIEHGIGFQKDSAKALKWIALAADLSSEDKQKLHLQLSEVIRTANPIWDDGGKRDDGAGPAMDSEVTLGDSVSVAPEKNIIYAPLERQSFSRPKRVHSYSIVDEFKALEGRTTQLSDLADSQTPDLNKKTSSEQRKSGNCSCCMKKPVPSDYDYRRVEDADDPLDVDSSRRAGSYCSRCCCILL